VANDNLRRSGVSEDRIFFVGNTMIDTLLANLERLRSPDFVTSYGLDVGQYFIVTLHRPSNVDHSHRLLALLTAIATGSRNLPVVFPVHPRTVKVLGTLGPLPINLLLVDPLPYLEFNWLVKHAKAVITDSGGVTEEATVLGIPCMTLRNTTERPETVTLGTNVLVGTEPTALAPAFETLFEGNWKRGLAPPLWDGFTGERIVRHLESLLTVTP
jgi:UDP-N-acetylglucosamine 2-epimerase (non-hydrolysing)